MEVAAIVIGMLTLVAGVMLMIYWYEKARTARFQAVAEELGLQFHAKSDPAIQSALGNLRLFNQGRGRRTTNMLVGETNDVDVAIFGYRYRTGSGKHQHAHVQSVISFQSPHMSLPNFELRPENIFHKIGQALGYKDIDFDSHPTFSQRYILRGPDESAIRELFTPEVLQNIEAIDDIKDISVEAAHDRLIYYRANRRIKPEDVRAFMAEGFRVYGIFK